MATATRPAYTVAVKGDPATKTLGDCPFSQRVLLTLESKHIPYEKDYIDFANKPKWLMDASKGKVPVLMDKGSGMVLPDSDVITEYLEKQHPEPSMVSEVPPEIGTRLFPALREYLSSSDSPGEEAAKRVAVEEELERINAYLAEPGKGPLFGGDAMNATDAALAPKLYHTKIAAGHFKGYSFPGDMIALNRYMDALVHQPAWIATAPAPDVVIAGWKSHEH